MPTHRRMKNRELPAQKVFQQAPDSWIGFSLGLGLSGGPAAGRNAR
jgi:hypothetical protein